MAEVDWRKVGILLLAVFAGSIAYAAWEYQPKAGAQQTTSPTTVQTNPTTTTISPTTTITTASPTTTTAVPITTTAAPTATAGQTPTTVMNGGGPRYGPVPLLLSGRCPTEYPVKRGDGCYADASSR